MSVAGAGRVGIVLAHCRNGGDLVDDVTDIAGRSSDEGAYLAVEHRLQSGKLQAQCGHETARRRLHTKPE